MSPEIQAVTTIFKSSRALEKFMPLVNIEKNSFRCENVDLKGLSSGEKAGFAWAKAIWGGEVDQNMVDLMSGFGLLDRNIKIAIVVAMDLVHQISQPEDDMSQFPILEIIQKEKSLLN